MQITIVVASFLLVIRHLVHRSYSKVSVPEGNASAISLAFELPGQLLRAASLAFMIVVAAKESSKWTDVIALAYAFVLGLLRLVNDVEWRHVALHHVNFVLAGSLLTLVAEELLPYIDADYTKNLSPMLICTISALTASVLVSLFTRREWIPPSLDLDVSEKIATREPSPEETCSWLEYYVTYEWLTPLMVKGMRGKITLEGLPQLPWYDEPTLLLSRVLQARQKGKSTLRTLVRFLHTELLTMSCWITTSFVLEQISPFAMYKLLGYLSNPEGSSIRPWLWLILLFVGPLSRSVGFQQYIFTSTRVVVRIKAALTQELYYKAMNSMELDDEVFAEISSTGKEKGNKQQGTTSTGRLANLMSAEVDAVTRGRDIILVVCGISAGSIVSMIGLYKLMGWPALVGIITMIALSPFPVLIARHMVGTQREMKRIQDSRISVISEYLASIRAIKYFAWEEAIIKRVNEIRFGEQRKIWGLNIL